MSEPMRAFFTNTWCDGKREKVVPLVSALRYAAKEREEGIAECLGIVLRLAAYTREDEFRIAVRRIRVLIADNARRALK